MSRGRGPVPLSQREVPARLRERVRAPLAVVLGSPAEVINLLAALDGIDAICYQMDLHQSERLTAELTEAGLNVKVVTLADLWDLPADFQSAVFMPSRGGERALKIDMLEQAFHVLRPAGAFVVWSSYEDDPFFPPLLKKVFGRIHEHREGPDTVLWAHRQGDHPRRRLEQTFHARIGEGDSCHFVSRPGVFSYGRLDDGARALVETAVVHPGDRVVDVGCGCGTNGVFAGRAAGAEGFVAFVDSNVRATSVAAINATGNGLTQFETVTTSRVEGIAEGSWDVVLANPPYFAGGAIARFFVDRSRSLLKREGRFYLVTRQPREIAETILDTFGHLDAIERRGYTILVA